MIGLDMNSKELYNAFLTMNDNCLLYKKIEFVETANPDYNLFLFIHQNTIYLKTQSILS